jgi:cytochrome b
MNARSDHQSPVKSPAPDALGYVRVWDPLVRLFHWTVVTGCAINLIAEDGNKVHRTVGYVVAGAVVVRILWGFIGRGHALFTDFVPRPSELSNYVRVLVARREARYIGHNPAGSVMILALLGALIGVSVTGG